MLPWEEELYEDPNEPGGYVPRRAPEPFQRLKHRPMVETIGDPPASSDGDYWTRNPDGTYTGRNGEVTVPENAPFGDGSGGGGTRRPYQFQSLDWPDWSPPEFHAPPPFEYGDFKPPTLADAVNEPGYKFAADEGAKRIQNNAAARGNVVSGAAIKDLVKWSNDYATQNYNGVYGRGLQTWQSNRNNAADNYMTNYNVSRDVFDRSYTSSRDQDTSRRERAKLNFQRDWDIYQSDLDTKKYISGLGAN